MNYLKQIYLPDENNRCIAIFYTSEIKKGSIRKGSTKIDNVETESQNHCELFNKSVVHGIGLNRDSFVLRFPNRKTERLMKFKLTHVQDQVPILADMAQICFGGGLKVIEHYAKLGLSKQKANELKEIIKKE